MIDGQSSCPDEQSVGFEVCVLVVFKGPGVVLPLVVLVLVGAGVKVLVSSVVSVEDAMLLLFDEVISVVVGAGVNVLGSSVVEFKLTVEDAEPGSVVVEFGLMVVIFTEGEGVAVPFSDSELVELGQDGDGSGVLNP